MTGEKETRTLLREGNRINHTPFPRIASTAHQHPHKRRQQTPQQAHGGGRPKQAFTTEAEAPAGATLRSAGLPTQRGLGTGWFKHKTQNSFRVHCPRRFEEIDREFCARV